jgi:cytochrome b561
MMDNTLPPRYGTIAITFHWLLAIMITASFSVGLYMVSLTMSPTRIKLYNWHKWAGIAILTLSALRLLWRLKHPAPPVPAGMPQWQKSVAGATHLLLYLLFFAVPLTGWAYSSAAGFPIVWFGVIPLPDFVPKDRELAEFLKPFHWMAAYALASLVVLHILAVIKHLLMDDDNLLSRMLPSTDGEKS